jgi:hypothetical protein
MRRVCTTMAILALCLAPVRADVTIKQVITIEGPMAGAVGEKPVMTIRIKGNKSRSDVTGPAAVSAISDLDAKQVIVLNGTEKTAQILSLASTGSGGTQQPAFPASAVSVDYKPTGAKRTIEGAACDDYAFTMTMDMSELGNTSAMPPEAVEALKGVKMIANGVTCLAKEGKGVQEFVAYQKAAIQSGIMGAMMGGTTPGKSGGGMEKLMAAVASAPGLPYVTEVTMTFEGTGPMVDMMKQMGAMKIIQTTTSVSTDPIGDELFKVPADYKVTEKK